jgi:type IV pilus assembly protein PilV
MPIRAVSKGFTLIETLITLALISFGVIGIIRLQNYLAYDTSVFQQKNEALVLAVKQIETLRDFPVIKTTSGYTYSYQTIASSVVSVSGKTATFTVTTTVTSFLNPTYKNIDVTVSWSDRYNASQSVRMVSIVASVDPSYSAVIM